MAERTHIPSSRACGEWETLLADALDDLLMAEDKAKFTAHMAACPACAVLYEESRKGREWLEFLSPDPEPPAGLLEKILAKTGPGHKAAGEMMPMPAAAGTVPAFVPPVWQQPGFMARVRSTMQPRLMLTAAMAFFSIALTLNMTGIRMSEIHVTPIRLADLRPRAVRAYMERQLNMASVPIVRYYDHLRFVYEVESRVRELRGEDARGEGGTEEQQRKDAQPATPGETRQNPGGNLEGPRTNPNQELGPNEESGSPAMAPATDETDGLLESSLEVQAGPTATTSGSALRGWERNTLWIA
jgi:Putative zinc-finger